MSSLKASWAFEIERPVSVSVSFPAANAAKQPSGSPPRDATY